ncbi:MAG: transporter substrate-binding domain-containing protein [Hyphomicrobiaceae bacterium]|nr:transporter substrate-binding domain-containing protein [Hyphomicrobiaceae bacterium]MCC0022599.1 transporter substrate-binding domain-containing protein [Hyphomicrobiaceae bacterium]
MATTSSDTQNLLTAQREGNGPGLRLFAAILSTVLLLLVLGAGIAAAQTFPDHFDTTQREDAPDLSAVPSLRILAMTGFPPFSFRQANGELTGYNIDLAKSMCAKLGVVCTIQAWPFEQAADALADNQGDVLLGGLAITPENVDRFDFSAIYLGFPARFVALKQNADTFDPGDLGGKSIAVRVGGVHEEFLKDFLSLDALKPAPTEIEALAMVKSGAADLYFGDAMRASFWLNENLECCAFAGDAYYRPDIFGDGLAMAVPAGHDAVRNAVNWALQRLNRDGTLRELYLRWFPVGFY